MIPYTPGTGAASALTFNGGTFDLSLIPTAVPGDIAKTPLVQTIRFRFPATVGHGGAAQPIRIPFPAAYAAGPPANDFAYRITNFRGGGVGGGAGTWISWIQKTDGCRSVEAATDLRLIAARKNVDSFAGSTTAFFDLTGAKSRWLSNGGVPVSTTIHSLRCSNGERYHDTGVPAGNLAYQGTFGGKPSSGSPPFYRYDPGSPFGTAYMDPRTADLPETRADGVTLTNGVLRKDGQSGDWDTGISKQSDGPFINKTDEGNSAVTAAYPVPYFQQSSTQNVGGTYFSPNRILASAGWFGSLPTGVQRNLPYQTLLFRPDGNGGSGATLGSRSNHPGAANPPDHLIMDLFNMPVVEPYPISEPFSTAGKINLNFQIMPFGKYLKRDTAMRALLRSEKMFLIPVDAYAGGKAEDWQSQNGEYLHEIDEDTTLAFMERRWNNTFFPNPEDQVFRSPTQICEVDLYPKQANGAEGKNNLIPVFKSTDAASQTQSAIDKKWGAPGTAGSFWDYYRLTGDNARERPYARLYSRLTTKSNTFTVHLKVQTLQKRISDPNQDTWDEDKDQVTGEYRGSALIERYIDPSDRRFNPNDSTTKAQGDQLNPDHFGITGTATDHDILEAAYKFRVLSTKQFGQ